MPNDMLVLKVDLGAGCDDGRWGAVMGGTRTIHISRKSITLTPNENVSAAPKAGGAEEGLPNDGAAAGVAPKGKGGLYDGTAAAAGVAPKEGTAAGVAPKEKGLPNDGAAAGAAPKAGATFGSSRMHSMTFCFMLSCVQSTQ